MSTDPYDSGGRENTLLVTLAAAGWVVALVIGAAFAWFAFWGPGSDRSPAETAPAPTVAAVATCPPTAAPTDEALAGSPATPEATATARPTETPLSDTAASPLPTPELPTGTLTVNEGGANVRSGPSTEDELIGELDEGDRATITGRLEDWFLIDFEGEPGWVANWVVQAENIDGVPTVDATGSVVATAAPREPVTKPTFIAGAGGANVRSGPGTDFELVGTLDSGATAPITGLYEDWYRIEFEGEEAWVAGWVGEAAAADDVPELELTPTATPEATPEGEGEDTDEEGPTPEVTPTQEG